MLKSSMEGLFMVTCIDISTLYPEKRGIAIKLINQICQLDHPCLMKIINWWQIPDQFIFIESEAPLNTLTNPARISANKNFLEILRVQMSQNHTRSQFNTVFDETKYWKSYCKKKMNESELSQVIRRIVQALMHLHNFGIIHRDVHPSRFLLFSHFDSQDNSYQEIIKFNAIGMPFNFKKLIKRDNFSGHVNYSPPELIDERSDFSEKVDVWSLGCCIFYLIIKKDPFEGNNHRETKKNILNQMFSANLTLQKFLDDRINNPRMRQLISMCLRADPTQRLSMLGVLDFLDKNVNVPRFHDYKNLAMA
jgi:serine/threonine protein kinase